MIRHLTLGCGLALIGLAVLATLFHGGMAAFLALGVPGLVLVFGLFYERITYKPLETSHPGSGWQWTTECFIDPESHTRVRVYFNDATGARKYVAE